MLIKENSFELVYVFFRVFVSFFKLKPLLRFVPIVFDKFEKAAVFELFDEVGVSLIHFI